MRDSKNRIIRAELHLAQYLAFAHKPILVPGVDQVYEKPECPDLVVKTVECSIEESTLQVVELLEEHVSIRCYVPLDVCKKLHLWIS